MRHHVIIAATAVVAIGCFRHEPQLPASIPVAEGARHTLFALTYIDVVQGAGAAVAPRRCLFANYTGWLTNGTKFDSSRDTMPNGKQREPISFPQGSRRVIAGWDVGFEGMKVGGQRRLFIPYQLAYGESGRPPLIPAKAELIFAVELMAVADTLARRPDSSANRPATPPVPLCPTWKAVSGG